MREALISRPEEDVVYCVGRRPSSWHAELEENQNIHFNIRPLPNHPPSHSLPRSSIYGLSRTISAIVMVALLVFY